MSPAVVRTQLWARGPRAAPSPRPGRGGASARALWSQASCPRVGSAGRVCARSFTDALRAPARGPSPYSNRGRRSVLLTSDCGSKRPQATGAWAFAAKNWPGVARTALAGKPDLGAEACASGCCAGSCRRPQPARSLREPPEAGTPASAAAPTPLAWPGDKGLTVSPPARLALLLPGLLRPPPWSLSCPRGLFCLRLLFLPWPGQSRTCPASVLATAPLVLLISPSSLPPPLASLGLSR